MKTQEEYKRIATEQSQEVYNLLNGVEWDEAPDILDNVGDDVYLHYFIDKDNEFIDLDYKEINIAIYKDENDKVCFKEQNVEVWDEEESAYYPFLFKFN